MKAGLVQAVTALRRHVPARLFRHAVRWRSALLWRRAGVRDDARAQMRFVLGDDLPGPQLEQVARAYLYRMTWRGESRFQRGLLRGMKVAGAEHLRAASAAGRGAVVTMFHHGGYDGLSASIRAQSGQVVDVIADTRLFAPDARGWVQQRRRNAAAGGVPMHPVSIGSAGIRRLLSDGRSVLLALDVPGRSDVRVFGHDLVASSGAVRIAFDAGAPLVMVTSCPDPELSDVPMNTISAPLQPGDFASAEQLLEVVVAHHEQAVLAWPEAADEPLSRFERREIQP